VSGGIPRAPLRYFYIFKIRHSVTFLSFIFHSPMTLLVGQVETLMPELLQAMEDADAAKRRVDDLKAQMIALIEEPQTVKTCWGSVTLNRGRRTVKVTDKALNAQITLLKESGISEGKCEESVGSPFVTVRKSDR